MNSRSRDLIANKYIATRYFHNMALKSQQMDMHIRSCTLPITMT